MPNDLKLTLPKLMSSNGGKKFFFAYAAGKRKDGKGDGELLVRGTKPKKTEIEGEMADCKEVVEGVCWTGKTADDAGTVYMQGKGKKISAMLVSKISLTAKRITGKQYDFQVPSEAEEARVAALAEGDGAPADGAAAPGTEAAAAPGTEAKTAAPGAEVKTAAPGAEAKTAAPVPDGKKAEAAKAPATDGKAVAPSQFKEAQARLKGLLSRQQALLAKNPALKNRLVPASQPATSLVSTYKTGAPIEPVLAALNNLENALLAGEAEEPAAASAKAAQPAAEAGPDLAAEYKASLAEWTPTIKQAMADKGKNAAAIAKRLSQANALSKPGGNYAEALKILGEAFSLAGGTVAEPKTEAPDGNAKKEEAPKAEKKESEAEEKSEPKSEKEEAPTTKTEKEEESETPETTSEKQEKTPESSEPKVQKPEAKKSEGEKEPESKESEGDETKEPEAKKSEGEEKEAPETKESEGDEPKEPEAKKSEGEEVKAPDKKARAATRQEAARLRKEMEGLQPRIETAVANHPDRKDELEKPHKAFVKQVTQRSEAALKEAEKSLAEVRKVLESVEKAKTDKKAGKKKEPKDFTTKFKETQELLKQLPEGDDAEDLVDQMEDLEFAVKMEALWSMEGELAPDKAETLKAIKTAAKELIAKGGGAKKSDKGKSEGKEEEGDEKAEGKEEEGDEKAKGKKKKKEKDKKEEEKEPDAKVEGEAEVKAEDETEEEEEEEEEPANFDDALKAMDDLVAKLTDDNPLSKGIQRNVEGFKDRLTTEAKLIEQGMLEKIDVEKNNKDMVKSIKMEVRAAGKFEAAVKTTRALIEKMSDADPVRGMLLSGLDNQLKQIEAGAAVQPSAALKFMKDLEKQSKNRTAVTTQADQVTKEIEKLAGDNVFKTQLQNRVTNTVASANPNNADEIAKLLTSIQEDVKNAATLETKFAELKAGPDEFIGEEANDPIRNELAARLASMQRGAATLRISESFGEIMKMIDAEEKAVASAVEYWKKASEVSAAVDELDTETPAGKELADQFQALGKMIGAVNQIPLGMKEMNALLERVKKAAAESKPTEKEEESETPEKEGEAKAKKKKKGESEPSEKEEESKEDDAKTGKKESKPKKEKAKKKEGKEE